VVFGGREKARIARITSGNPTWESRSVGGYGLRNPSRPVSHTAFAVSAFVLIVPRAEPRSPLKPETLDSTEPSRHRKQLRSYNAKLAGFLPRCGAYSTPMGMFTNLMSKIFGHATAAPSSAAIPASPAVASPTAAVAAVTPTTPKAPAASATSSSPAAAPVQAVDVTAILDNLAAKNPEKLDWRKSIVDLMKLVGIDSSLAARKQLAAELHYSGDEKDSAAMNIWLHKEVIKKIAENGGKVPQELLG